MEMNIQSHFNLSFRDAQILMFASINIREWEMPSNPKRAFKTVHLRNGDCTPEGRNADAAVQGIIAGYLFRAAELAEEIEGSLGHQMTAEWRQTGIFPDWYCGR